MPTLQVSADPRCNPLIHLDRPTIEAMIAPVLDTGARSVVRVEGGLTNTTYRVTAADGAEYGLRVYAAGREAFDLERRLLPALCATIPVPEVLFADAGGAQPYLVYRWIDGVTLNECRRREGPAALLALAEPLGQVLAAVCNAAPLVAGDRLLAEARIDARLAQADDRLRTGPARERLGGTLADDLCARLAADAARLQALDDAGGLIHGDFGGRNVLVRRSSDGWKIAGVIDWEAASMGSGLWDVGSLFRYPQRYSPASRAEFERGYRAAGGELPDDWWAAARLLDSTRLVGILAEPRELPTVFAECRDLIAAIVAVEGVR